MRIRAHAHAELRDGEHVPIGVREWRAHTQRSAQQHAVHYALSSLGGARPCSAAHTGNTSSGSSALSTWWLLARPRAPNPRLPKPPTTPASPLPYPPCDPRENPPADTAASLPRRQCCEPARTSAAPPVAASVDTPPRGAVSAAARGAAGVKVCMPIQCVTAPEGARTGTMASWFHSGAPLLEKLSSVHVWLRPAAIALQTCHNSACYCEVCRLSVEWNHAIGSTADLTLCTACVMEQELAQSGLTTMQKKAIELRTV